MATVDARLFAIDAASGSPCVEFGDGGSVRLTSTLGIPESVGSNVFSVTSPPVVADDVVIVGSAVNKSAGGDHLPGDVQGFDARSGKLRWSFNPLAAPTDTSLQLSVGGGNVWSIMTVDTANNMIFLPTSSAAPTFYGGDREGRNEYANSLVALHGTTGQLVWAYQLVHHDLWDYDVAAQPILLSVRRGGRLFRAVAVATKTGMIFVLDRFTGRPLYEVREMPVPTTAAIGERVSPSQPFSTGMPSLHSSMLHADSAFGITVEERDYCYDWISALQNDGIFTPPSVQGTLVWPGFWGGVNWSGMGFDPNRRRFVAVVQRLAMVIALHDRSTGGEAVRVRRPGAEYLAQRGAPYAATRMPLVAPSGVPCSPPPWSELVAVDQEGAQIRWKEPIGVVPTLAGMPDATDWGSIAFGGPLLTAGGLVFVGGSQDDLFRAFDIGTGELLWQYALPAGGQAAPMTYRYGGRQYVVIAAGGRGGIGTFGDWIVSFTLAGR